MLLKFFWRLRVSMRPLKPLMRSIWDHGSGFGRLYETAEAASAFSIRLRKPYISNNYLDFLGEFEAIFETALVHESGPWGGLFDGKNQGSKILWHCLFKANAAHLSFQIGTKFMFSAFFLTLHKSSKNVLMHVVILRTVAAIELIFQQYDTGPV
jgi:hypothetical protein